MITITELSNGLYVCQGGIWKQLPPLLEYLKQAWSAPYKIVKADERTDAFWLREAEALEIGKPAFKLPAVTPTFTYQPKFEETV